MKLNKLIKTTIAILFISTVFTSYGQSRKGISILGDSYSTFENCVVPDTNYVWYWEKSQSKNDVHNAADTWWHKLISEEGYRLCKNNSFSGSTVCNTGYKGKDYSDRSFIARMKNLGSPDLIYIFGGTNDSWAGVPVGEFKFEDWTADDLYKFRPATAYMLASMQKFYLGTEIVFLINNDLSEDVTESIKSICDHYGVDYIQLVGIDRIEGHPSVKGMRQIVDQIKAHNNTHSNNKK